MLCKPQCADPGIHRTRLRTGATRSRKSKERKQRIFRVLLKAFTKITDLPAPKTYRLHNGISGAREPPERLMRRNPRAKILRWPSNEETKRPQKEPSPNPLRALLVLYAVASLGYWVAGAMDMWQMRSIWPESRSAISLSR